eukprot:gene1887-biopygen3371
MQEEADGDASQSWYKPGPDVLTQLHPAGEPEQPHDAAWTVHPTGKWILGNHPEATAEQMARMVQMLERNKEAFAYSLSEVPGYSGDPVDFTLIDSSQRMLASQRQYTEEELKFGDEKVQEMLEAGIVVEISTTNPVASCITLPMKRAPDGSWTDKRFCIDLRAVNSNTVVDKFGLPLPEVLFRKMAGAKFLTKIDLRSGFWQLRLSEAAQKLVAFWWRGRMYTYTRLPFGHVNATALFQRVMETELAAAGIQRGVAFVDDVSVWDNNFEEHIEQVDRLLQRFIAVRLRAHPSKTVVAAEKLGYLGHLVSASVCQPEEAKVAAIQALQAPSTVKKLQAHLGLFNYYRCYVPEFAQVAQPLYQLLKKDVPFVWSAACQEAYDKLKAALCTPGLALRQPVPDRPFHLYVDWSQSGIAAVLHQRAADNTEYLVGCASRSLNQSERNYPAWKGEMLAAVWGVKMFRPYLHAGEFFLHTDHRALLWLLTHKEPVGQQMRWILTLQEYKFTLVHKPGASNPADVPSREPVSCVADCTGARLDDAHQAWPLPAVRCADMTPDLTVYTHEQLSVELGMALTSAKPSAKAPHPACLLAMEDLRHPSLAQLQHETLKKAAAAWATLGAIHLGPSFQPAPTLPGRYLEQARQTDSLGLRLTSQLNTAPCADTFFRAAHEQGLVLWEPCGGICAGLEMLLRNGFKVARYFHSDIDPLATRLAAHRILQLQELFPEQLLEAAVRGCFDAMPSDIRTISSKHLHLQVQETKGLQWMVVAGWPCQDFSLAGPSRGLKADRSQLLFELVRLVGVLQQLQQELPPAYLFENVPFQYHRKTSIADQDFSAVAEMIGQPVTLDATQAGSFAHRLRNYWTNLCHAEQLEAAFLFIRRAEGRELQCILEPGRIPQAVTREDRAPQHVCNLPGQPRKALPTIMSRAGSYAFRPGQPGSILDTTQDAGHRLTEPTAQERERAMGYLPGSTAAEGVSEEERCRAIGQGMDANSLQLILATTEAYWLVNRRDAARAGKAVFVALEPIKQQCQMLEILTVQQPFSTQRAICMAAAGEELAGTGGKASGDVWKDQTVLDLLNTGKTAQPVDATELRRAEES